MGNLLNRQAPAQAAGGAPRGALPAPAAGALQLQQLNNPAAAAPTGGMLTIVVSCTTMMGIFQALVTKGYTPGLVPAIPVAFFSLVGGAWAATQGRERTIIASVILSLSFVAMAMAMAGGAELNLELALNIFKAVKTILEAMR